MYQTFVEIGIINQLAEAFLRRALPKPLTVAQFQVLSHLLRLPGQHTPSAITKSFQVTKGAMTHTLGLLTKNGWVEIMPDPDDGRSKQVSISSSGRDIFLQTVEKLTPYFTELATIFPPQDIKALTNTLENIRVFMDENRDLEIK